MVSLSVCGGEHEWPGRAPFRRGFPWVRQTHGGEHRCRAGWRCGGAAGWGCVLPPQGSDAGRCWIYERSYVKWVLGGLLHITIRDHYVCYSYRAALSSWNMPKGESWRWRTSTELCAGAMWRWEFSHLIPYHITYLLSLCASIRQFLVAVPKMQPHFDPWKRASFSSLRIGTSTWWSSLWLRIFQRAVLKLWFEVRPPVKQLMIE